MAIDPGLPQRVAVVIEQNKSDSWSVAAYLITVNGHRERRRLAVRDTYTAAADVLKRAWGDLEAED
ncbi:MAG TPA: hypothetical protein VGA50_11735 [Kiloniellales bacterium]